jgi:hypothetical protein
LADDLSGLKTTLSQAMAALLTSAATANDESAYRLAKAWQAEMKKAATANGVTGI